MRLQRPFTTPDRVLRRREWRRIERRARRTHEDEQLARLHELSGAAVPVLFIETFDDHACARLTLPEALVLLAGVSPCGLAILRSCAVRGSGRLADAGRYLQHWWVELDAGERQAVLAPRLRLVPTDGADSHAPLLDLTLWQDR